MITRRKFSRLLMTVAALSICLPLSAAAQSAIPAEPSSQGPKSGSVSAPMATPPTPSVPSANVTEPRPVAAAADKAPPPAPTPAATGESATKPPIRDNPANKDVASVPGKDASLTALDIGGVPLARLLESDNSFSGLGSFKKLLPTYGISTYIHGIALGNFTAQTTQEPALLNHDGFNNNPTFGAEFNLFVGAELANRVFAEMQIFYGSEANTISIDYAQLDVRIFRDYLFVRGGRFRVPLGNINGYPDPRFTFKLPILPQFFFRKRSRRC